MKKILVIDDDEDLAGLVKDILLLKGFHVHTHLDGSNVPYVVKHFNPDLILLEIRLYRASGTGICRELKGRYHTPILLFSADTAKGEAFADCEADGFLKKPFNISDLLNIINQHLQSSKAVA